MHWIMFTLMKIGKRQVMIISNLNISKRAFEYLKQSIPTLYGHIKAAEGWVSGGIGECVGDNGVAEREHAARVEVVGGGEDADIVGGGGLDPRRHGIGDAGSDLDEEVAGAVVDDWWVHIGLSWKQKNIFFSSLEHFFKTYSNLDGSVVKYV